ncbi:hypothetical protein F5Y18DRAFT_395758, partial [Xylariaceae sp. FL1019]
MLCDVTGVPLNFAKGVDSISVEAMLPCTLHTFSGEQDLSYHTPNNIVAIAKFLNFIKGHHIPLVLNILAEYSRIMCDDSKSLHDRRPRLLWLLNALSNAEHLGVWGRQGRNDLTERLAAWGRGLSRDGKLESDLFNDFVDAARTGQKTEVVDKLETEFYAEMGTKGQNGQIYRRGLRRTLKVDIPEHTEPLQEEYNKLHELSVQIGTAYELSLEDFEYYLTTKSTDPSGKRILFLFHVSARGQCEWTDAICYRHVWETGVMMDDKCNRNAVALGIQEDRQVGHLLLHDVHVACQQLRDLKKQFPDEERHNLRWRLFHHEGFPIYPFRHSPLGASYGKRGRHAISMETLFRGEDLNAEGFDPADLTKWNPDKGTIIRTAWLINVSQWEYSDEVLPSIRAMLHCVPLHGPEASPVDDLGMEVWGVPAAHDIDGYQPKAPSSGLPGNTTVLLPKEKYLDSSIEPSYDCMICGREHRVLGALVNHVKRDHYKSSFRCVCGQHEGSQYALDLHNERFHSPDILGHAQDYWERDEAERTCDQCRSILTFRQNRTKHALLSHSFFCDAHAECQLKFVTEIGYYSHVLDQHPETHAAEKIRLAGKLVTCPDCGCWTSTKHFVRHQSIKHDPTSKEVEIVCSKDDCKSRYTGGHAIGHFYSHLNNRHNDHWCKDCWVWFPNTKEKRTHIDKSHNLTLTYAEEVGDKWRCLFCNDDDDDDD